MQGIPRWVTDAEEGESEKRQNEQIRSLKDDTLATVMKCKAYLELPSQTDKDLLFRIEPSADKKSFAILLTSPYVERELAYRFVESAQFGVQNLAAAVENIPVLSHILVRVNCDPLAKFQQQ